MTKLEMQDLLSLIKDNIHKSEDAYKLGPVLDLITSAKDFIEKPNTINTEYYREYKALCLHCLSGENVPIESVIIKS